MGGEREGGGAVQNLRKQKENLGGGGGGVEEPRVSEFFTNNLNHNKRAMVALVCSPEYQMNQEYSITRLWHKICKSHNLNKL